MSTGHISSLMRNPFTKFQNPTYNFFEQMNEQTDKPKAICPLNFFKVGGIKTI